MKKYRITEFAATTYFIGAIFPVIGLIITVPTLWEWQDWTNILPTAICVIGLLIMAYQLAFDFHMGWFTLSEEGITLHIGLKDHAHKWSDFIEYGFVDVDAGSATNKVDTYWVYCSTRVLTRKEKELFLFKTRFDLKNIAFFQYKKDAYDEMLKYMPQDGREMLELFEKLLKWKKTPFG